MTTKFEQLGLQAELLQAVEELGFTEPTPIQQAAIPALVEGRNVIGQAQTGTGKTAAYGLPMLQQIEAGTGQIQALVLAPTRELAIQVTEAVRQFARHTGTQIMTVYGGQSYGIQKRQLRRGVEVVVGTPGRLLDLMRQNLLDLSQVRYLVLDEADEMLEMGFIEDVETIVAAITGERQIALFSATLPDAVRKLADRYLSDPQVIRINPKRMTVAATQQFFCRVKEENKLAALIRMLEAEEIKSALVFTRTKARAQEIADALIQNGYPAESLHGDLNQSRRESVLKRFRHASANLLVATDVAARGLDIDDISHVFNYDVPQDAEDYVHRIGRTGRAGREGNAITFVTPRDRRQLGQIEAFTRQSIQEYRLPTRKEIQARRDERLLERIIEQMVQGENNDERALVDQLAKIGYDMRDVAAAAIQMARREEKEISFEEIKAPEFDQKPDRKKNGRKRDRFEKKASRNGRSKRQYEAGMVRLKMNLGGAQGVRPNDVVGAIASEVGIPGRAIGEIDIRKNYTFVDVAEKHVHQVLEESSGKYSLRGKPVLLKRAN